MNNKLLFAGLIALTACSPVKAPLSLEERVDSVLQTLSLEDKIGQMTQLTLSTLAPEQHLTPQSNPTLTIPTDRLDTLFGHYRVGSMLNTDTRPLTPEQWLCIQSQIQHYSVDSLGVPCLYGLDMIHGASYAAGSTLFPQPINVAATFNVDLAHRCGEVTAYETRACNVPWTFCPTVDLSRDPRWPRVWEDFGEDACLSSAMGVAMVRGLQGEHRDAIDGHHIAATMKHYMGYGVPVSGHDRTHAVIAEHELREKHFAPFAAGVVDGGALSVMVNSGAINGTPVHANARLLTQWLKEELAWDGVIVTDWSDINNLYRRDFVAADKKEAIRLAINAGIDLSMEPYETNFCTLLAELVREGKVSQSRIDDAVRRIIRMKMRLGLFDRPLLNPADYPLYGSDEHAADALRTAKESMILLKNEGDLLPLAEGTRILVCGPNGHSLRTLNGGWSYTWQGELTDSLGKGHPTIFDALSKRFGTSRVRYVAGVSYGTPDKDWQVDRITDLDAAVRAAREADVIIACIGENSYTETPGNIADLRLSANQRELVNRMAATGKPVVLILNGGRPRLINDIEPKAQAVVDILLPGNSGATALASLLAGDDNFSGKLPYTYPNSPVGNSPYDFPRCNQVQTMAGEYNYNAVVNAQWPFGYGLSYTTFDYCDLHITPATFAPTDTLTLTVTVKNTGHRAGKEAVLVYSSDLVASRIPDIRRLRAFSKVALQPGESADLCFRLPAADLAFVDANGRWTLEEGAFRFKVGAQEADVTCTSTHVWEKPGDYYRRK